MEEHLSKVEDRVSSLETRVAVVETNIKNLNKTLDGIKSNTTWILRIIVGAVVAAILNFFLRG